MGYPQDIPGLEFAGEVEDVGEQASLWKRGQRVFGITAGGAHAEYVGIERKLWEDCVADVGQAFLPVQVIV